MSALTVLIIRHAEKPEEAWPGPGLTEDGQPDKKSLVVRGWQRAGAWAALFGAGLGGDLFPRPTVIYAADPTSVADGEPSQRPFETIEPLAERLHLAPLTRWGHGDEAQLAAEIIELTGVVLVCWEHKLIASALLPALLGTRNLPASRRSGTVHGLTSCSGWIGRSLERPGPSDNSFLASSPVIPKCRCKVAVFAASTRCEATPYAAPKPSFHRTKNAPERRSNFGTAEGTAAGRLPAITGSGVASISAPVGRGEGFAPVRLSWHNGQAVSQWHQRNAEILLRAALSADDLQAAGVTLSRLERFLDPRRRLSAATAATGTGFFAHRSAAFRLMHDLRPGGHG
jgi:hypothetical protein